MLELLLIISKAFLHISYKITLRVICILRYINHNYSLIEIITPEDNVNINLTYSVILNIFGIRYKCSLCGKEKTISFATYLGSYKKIVILDYKISERTEKYYYYDKKMGSLTHVNFLLGKLNNGIYRIPLSRLREINVEEFKKEFMNRKNYVKAIVEKDYLTFAIFKKDGGF